MNENNSQKDNKNNHNLVGKIIIMFIISLAIAHLVCIKGTAPSWLDTNSQWIGFLGSYLSSIVTMVGIYWTIKYNREQLESDREFSRQQSKLDRDYSIEQSRLDREYAEKRDSEERRLQHIPYLKILFEDILEHERKDNTVHIIELDKKFKFNTFKHMRFINIGIGPMIDLDVGTDEYELFMYPVLDIKDEKNDIVEFRIKDEIQSVQLLIFYKDIFGNEYSQSVKINFWIENKSPYNVHVYLSDQTEVSVKRNNNV